MKTRKQFAEELCPYKNFKWHDEPCKRCEALEEILDEREKKIISALADKIATKMGGIVISASILDWLVGLVFGPTSFAKKCVKNVCDEVIDTLIEK